MYKLIEINIVETAIKINDDNIYKLIVKAFTHYSNEIDNDYDLRPTILFKKLYITKNLFIIKYLVKSIKFIINITKFDIDKFDIDSFIDLKIINFLLKNNNLDHKTKRKFCYGTRRKAFILENTLAKFYNKFKIEHNIDFNIKNKITIDVTAYFECIRHGFYNIINNISSLNKLHRNNTYIQILFLLALSGTTKLKYVAKYEQYNQNIINDVVSKLNIKKRYNQVLDL